MLDRNQLTDMGKWAGFLGIISIIGGVISCISIIGIIPGIISIILGLKLRDVKRFSDDAANSPDEMTQAGRLNLMVSDLGAYFKIQGIIIIIALVLAVIGIIVSLLWLPYFFSNLFNNYYYY
ncbi:MAG TPA: hypothetical protein GX505_09155 [Clostridiales bacterium]|nr:hypothetical protein [Clostridiales bacterium]